MRWPRPTGVEPGVTAIGESDYAWELLTATIAAEQLRLPHPVHTALRALASQTGC